LRPAHCDFLLKNDLLNGEHMKTLQVLLNSILFLCIWPGLVLAELTPEEIAVKLQATYNTTQSLTADFKQSTYSQMSSRKRNGAGTIILMKPGLMRWDYREPNRQVFVSDGKNISMFFAKENQLIITPAQQYLESDVTYSFFAGTGDILRDFHVSQPAEESLDMTNDYHIVVVPKKGHPQVDFINVWVDRSSFLLMPEA